MSDELIGFASAIWNCSKHHSIVNNREKQVADIHESAVAILKKHGVSVPNCWENFDFKYGAFPGSKEWQEKHEWHEYVRLKEKYETYTRSDGQTFRVTK